MYLVRQLEASYKPATNQLQASVIIGEPLKMSHRHQQITYNMKKSYIHDLFAYALAIGIGCGSASQVG